MRTAAIGAAALALAACGNVQMLPEVDLAQPDPAVLAPEPPPRLPANGSIYQASSFRPLFEDHRARHVGDTVTVQVVEKISATQSSTSSVDKNNSLAGSITALPGVNPVGLAKATIGSSSANTFAGKGTTVNSNDFSGTITAVVSRVLPNGHLIVTAEKQIGVNANVDVLRFSGLVDPKTIAPGNIVQSTQIANVRIEQRGRGQQAEAQSMGWLSRFFNLFSPI